MARPGFIVHPKFRSLVCRLKIPEAHALGHMEFLWMPAYENGDPIIGDALAVEASAHWIGKRGAFFKAVLACRLIDAVPEQPGVYQIHDLFDHAPRYIQDRMKREFERKAKGVTISEIRREAANKRWENQHANAMQTDANGVYFASSRLDREFYASLGITINFDARE